MVWYGLHFFYLDPKCNFNVQMNVCAAFYCCSSSMFWRNDKEMMQEPNDEMNTLSFEEYRLKIVEEGLCRRRDEKHRNRKAWNGHVFVWMIPLNIYKKFCLCNFLRTFSPVCFHSEMWSLRSKRQVYDDSEKGRKRQIIGNVFPKKIPTVDACESVDIFIMFPWLFNGNSNSKYEHEWWICMGITETERSGKNSLDENHIQLGNNWSE